MPIDWKTREAVFRYLASVFAVIGEDGVSLLFIYLKSDRHGNLGTATLPFIALRCCLRASRADT
jgi:hypothetical protein